MKTSIEAGTLKELLARLNLLETGKRTVLSVQINSNSNAGVVTLVNDVEHEGAEPEDPERVIECEILAGGPEEEQRARIAEILNKRNAPIDYTSIAVTGSSGGIEKVDAFFYWADGGAWLTKVTGPDLTLGANADRIPWDKAKRSVTYYEGLSNGGLAYFNSQTTGLIAVTAVTDADIDTDGPEGSKIKDRYWQPHTSLRNPDGSSCDSRTFPGVVIPPGMTNEFGVRMGDFALLCLNGREVPAQVYDGGPSTKIGEISFGAAVDLGIYPDRSDAVERRAATNGNDVNNLLTVFFPGSGNGRALSPELVKRSVNLCLTRWLGLPVVPVAGQQTFSQFIASLHLTHVTVELALATTSNAPNTMPPPELWPNIAPTLVVLDAIAEHFSPLRLSVNSTYRNVAYNSVVGGASRSQHTAFRAVDFSIKDRSPEEVAAFAKTLRGHEFTVPIQGLRLVNVIPGMPTPPPLDLTGLSFNSVPGIGTRFIYHGGIQDYDSFVHIDCRGQDVSWG